MQLIERRQNIVHDEQIAAPDSTAVRVALWRAMHVQVDPPPHVLEDEIGLRLVTPEDGWRRRPDMDPVCTENLNPSVVMMKSAEHRT
jgi:O-methyltransferase involved in polyketide biosynthesis